MAFDPNFRWLQDTIIPRNPAAPDFLQPVPCAYADDFAVVASSFRLFMTALFSPAFKVVDQTAGLNLNHRKCCWVQYGRDRCQSLLDWLATNCEEFREMKIIKYAKYVGTMIGPEGHIHCWTAPRKKSFSEPKKLHPPRVSWKDCVTLRYTLCLCLGIIGSISAPDEATLKEEAQALQCTTAGPCNAIPTDLLRVGSTCGLGPDILGIHTLSLAARHRTASNSVALANGMAKKQNNMILSHCCSQLRMKGQILEPTRLLYVAWILVANSTNLRKTKNNRLPQPCSATNCKSRTLPNQCLCAFPEFWGLSVALALHRFCLK